MTLSSIVYRRSEKFHEFLFENDFEEISLRYLRTLIKANDERGYTYLPTIVRKEVGLNGKGKIKFYVNANCVLLIREDTTKQDILEGLGVLIRDIDLRWKE